MSAWIFFDYVHRLYHRPLGRVRRFAPYTIPALGLLTLTGLSGCARNEPQPAQQAAAAEPQPEVPDVTGFIIAAPMVRIERLVSTDWLAGRLNDPRIKILHVGMDRAIYDAGHIPGAQFVGWEEVNAVVHGIPNEMPPLKDLVALARRLGIEHEDRIIIYDDRAGLEASRAYMVLEYLGMGDRTALLNGLLRKWQDEGRPLTTKPPAVQPSRFVPRMKNSIIAMQ